MKRVILAIAVAALLAPAGQVVFGKGHVPAHKDQLCHRGEVINVGKSAVAKHIAHGDVNLDQSTPPTLFPGDAC